MGNMEDHCSSYGMKFFTYKVNLLLINTLSNIYICSRVCVRQNNKMIEWFPRKLGSRQGAMSPRSFNECVDGVVGEVDTSVLGRFNCC